MKTRAVKALCMLVVLVSGFLTLAPDAGGGVSPIAGRSEGTRTGDHTRLGNTLNYRWICNASDGGERELSLRFNVGSWQGMQSEYGRRDHSVTKKWEKRFIFDDPYRGDLAAVAAALNQEAARQGIHVVDVALSFVQSFSHSEWTGQRYAIETLIDQTGDCSDKCMLLAGIFWELGIDYVILDLPGHLALAVWSVPPVGYHYWSRGRTYSYCETNGGLRPVGYCPEEFRNVGAGIRHPTW